MPVHLFGHPAHPGLRTLAEARGLALVEDAAQAHAASREGRPVGTWGTAAAFSFYATKNMTTGEGGMVVFADESAAHTARLLRNQGMERQYENELVGFNLRLTDIAATIGRVQLRRLEELTARRRANAAALDAALRGVVDAPAVAEETVHVYHQYTIRVEGRDRVLEALTDHDVESKVFYPIPVHRLAPYDLDLDLPQTALAARQVLSLPVGPHLSETDVAAVADAVLAAVGG
jgi:dTDP-4-amino-4,6-dideoxygalactose transaminase